MGNRTIALAMFELTDDLQAAPPIPNTSILVLPGGHMPALEEIIRIGWCERDSGTICPSLFLSSHGCIKYRWHLVGHGQTSKEGQHTADWNNGVFIEVTPMPVS